MYGDSKAIFFFFDLSIQLDITAMKIIILAKKKTVPKEPGMSMVIINSQ